MGDVPVWISAVCAVVAAAATVVTAIIAYNALNAWRVQKATESIVLWITSVVDYSTGIKFLPDTIDYKNNRGDVEAAAKLMYECIKRWKAAQLYARLDEDMHAKFISTYGKLWSDLTVEHHTGYINGKKTRKETFDCAVRLYNTEMK